MSADRDGELRSIAAEIEGLSERLAGALTPGEYAAYHAAVEQVQRTGEEFNGPDWPWFSVLWRLDQASAALSRSENPQAA